MPLHHIDLGDHFEQVDPSITPANFLQFSETAWRRYAKTSWSHAYIDAHSNPTGGAIL